MVDQDVYFVGSLWLQLAAMVVACCLLLRAKRKDPGRHHLNFKQFKTRRKETSLLQQERTISAAAIEGRVGKLGTVVLYLRRKARKMLQPEASKEWNRSLSVSIEHFNTCKELQQRRDHKHSMHVLD